MSHLKQADERSRENGALVGSSSPRPFIDEVAIDYGPRELLGQLFLQAHAEFARNGLTLSLAPMSILNELNRANSDSWPPLLQVFDDSLGCLNPGNSICIVARDADGEVVYTRAARRFDLGEGGVAPNFAELTRSVRHIYPSSADALARGEIWEPEGEAAKIMAGISGTISYSGAVWCHPRYRKRGFTVIGSLLGRAYSFARWNTDYTVTFMTEGVVGSGHATKTGYTHLVWNIAATNTSLGDLNLAFLWTDTAEILAQVEGMLADLSSEIDGVVVQG